MQEVWKNLEGYEGLYKISNLGNVINSKGNIMKYHKNWKGYLYIKPSKEGMKKFRKAHRMVAEHFIDNPYNKPCVNHLDGNKENNTVTNLEWCTYSENNKHAYKMGLR